MPEDSNQVPKPKSSNTATIIIIIVVILIVLGAGGYFVSRYFANKAAESIINSIPGTETGIKTTASWPTDLPVSVPRYSKGNIRNTIKLTSPKTWDILIDNSTQADFTTYLGEVEKQGWTAKGDVQFMADIRQYSQPGWDLTVVFDPSSNGVKITLVEAVK